MSRPKRDWQLANQKVEREGRCRNCGRTVKELARVGRPLERAHTIGRQYDLKLSNGTYLVLEASIVPLCGPWGDSTACHTMYDAHKIDLWDKLTPAERNFATKRLGPGQAKRKISGRAT